MLAIYKRELKSYFTSMVGYVFLAFYMLFLGLYFWINNLYQSYANFEYTMSSLCFIFIVLVPIITMRILAEEKKQKTDQLLFTSPVSITGIVVGKYLAVMTVYLIAMAVTMLCPLILSQFGDVSMGAAYNAILGFFLMGATYMALGMFLSAVAENQMVAAIISILVILLTNLIQAIASVLPTDALSIWLILSAVVLVIIGIVYVNTKNLTMAVILAAVVEGVMAALYVIKAGLYEGLITKICDWIAISAHFNDFASSILNLQACVYFISVAAIFLVLTVQTLNKRRWN